MKDDEKNYYYYYNVDPFATVCTIPSKIMPTNGREGEEISAQPKPECTDTYNQIKPSSKSIKDVDLGSV